MNSFTGFKVSVSSVEANQQKVWWTDNRKAIPCANLLTQVTEKLNETPEFWIPAQDIQHITLTQHQDQRIKSWQHMLTQSSILSWASTQNCSSANPGQKAISLKGIHDNKGSVSIMNLCARKLPVVLYWSVTTKAEACLPCFQFPMKERYCCLIL